MSVKVHYDMYHGYGELDKAIELLDDQDREGFRNFVNSEVSLMPIIYLFVDPRSFTLITVKFYLMA